MNQCAPASKCIGHPVDFHKMHVRLSESCHLCGVALNKHDYVSLDQDMVNSLYVRYNSSGRDVKGAITWIMENFHIRTFEDQTKFELDLSIRCFELLMKKISFHEEQEKDSFSQIIDRKFSDILSKRIMALQSDSSSQSVPNCFDSDE